MKILMILLFLYQQVSFATIDDECLINPNSSEKDCPNDPLHNDAYEMDYMNFSHAWDKAYGTARVFINDVKISPDLATDPEFGQRLRLHDSGTHYDFKVNDVNDFLNDRCRPINPNSGIREFYFFKQQTMRTEGAINHNQTDFSYHPDVFVNEIFKASGSGNQFKNYIEIAVKLGTPTNNLIMKLLDYDNKGAVVQTFNIASDFDFNHKNDQAGYRFYYKKNIDFGLILAPMPNPSSEYVIEISNNSQILQRFTQWISYPNVDELRAFNSITGTESTSDSIQDCGKYKSGLHIIASEDTTTRHGDLILSLYGATTDNNIGKSSICRECSLEYSYSSINRTNLLGGTAEEQIEERSWHRYTSSINAIAHGNQILSLSGFMGPAGNSESYYTCAQQLTVTQHQQSFCNTLKKSKDRDIVFVASAGNSRTTTVNWPANDTNYVIGVGGTDINGNIWDEGTCPFGNNDTGECGSQFEVGVSRVMAPAQDVLVYNRDGDYNPSIDCIDSNAGSINGIGTDNDGYQYCSGTSFSAPIIGGVVSIMRSLNPLLSFDEIKTMLSNSRVTTDNQGRTYSIPDAGELVKEILGQSNHTDVVNRLKPMFRLNHTFFGKDNYLSTSIPQLAVAAIDGTYLIEPNTFTGLIDPQDHVVYTPDTSAPLARGYNQFRAESTFNGSLSAHAPFYIFGGHENPQTGNDDLIPLYHFAYRALDNGSCYDEADHAYATNNNNAFINGTHLKCGNQEFFNDGIEGYILPTCPIANGCYEHTNNVSAPQCLRVRYSASDDSYALFMESEQNGLFSSYTTMVNGHQGMTDAECLGYVFPNVDSDNDSLIDGTEWVLGTDPNDNDSDGDNIADGVEYPPVANPVTDPFDPPVAVLPNITFAAATCGHRYCIDLRGTDFGTDARVEVREDVQGSPVLESYSGNLIHNQSVNSTTGEHLVRFPIVSVDQQTKFRNNGLCFTLFDGQLESNEICLVRPFTNPQGDFMGETVESHSTTQDIDFDAYLVKTAGTVLKIWGNSWKTIDYNYTVTPDTVLEFTFKSTHHEGEIAGIGFTMSGSAVPFAQRFFQVHGTQSSGIQDFHNYTGNGEITYTIPIGQYFTGQVSDMIFVSDDDNQRAGQANLFISPVLVEEVVVDDFDNISLRGYTDDVPGDAEPIFGGQAQQHNFHDTGDEDWVIFALGNVNATLNSIQQGNASAHMWAYEVTGAFTEISPGRWDITQSDLTLVDSDTSSGNNSVNFSNTSGVDKIYVVKVMSSGPVGSNTDYTLTDVIQPIIVDQYDDIAIRGYTDNIPGNAEPIFGGQPQQHNFHQSGDLDWVIFSMGNGSATLNAIQQGDASVHMVAYEVTGAFTETSPGRWDITESDLTMIDNDFSSGNNNVNFNNTSGLVKTYMVRLNSSGPVGSNTFYTLTD